MRKSLSIFSFRLDILAPLIYFRFDLFEMWISKNNSEGNILFGHSRFWIFFIVPTGLVICFICFWEKLNRKNFCLKNGRWEFINSSDFRRATIGWWKQLWSKSRFWTSKILHFLECSSCIVTCTWTSDLFHLFLR